VDLTDESWREAIEALLGVHRYAILVEPQHFDIANKVLDESSHKYVELINTKLLAGRKINIAENSVFHKLVIKNEFAAKYFAFWLGGIVAVDISEVASYESAMSKEGKLCRNMAVTFIDTKKIKSFALGQEAIEINLKRAAKQIEGLESEKARVSTEKKENDDIIEEIDEYQIHFRDFNYNAFSDFEENNRNLHKSNEELSRLIEAQKNNAEFIALNSQVQAFEEQLKKIEEELTNDNIALEKLKLANEGNCKNLEKHKSEQKDRRDELEGLEYTTPTEVKTAKREYDAFLSGNTKEGDVWAASTRENREGEQRSLQVKILSGQTNYNQRKNETERLPEGLQHEGAYQVRKNKIQIDDLQDIKAKIREQTQKYEAIFKNEFVLSIYQNSLTAKDDIAKINRELRKLKFSTQYQFDVNLINDKSNFNKILRYAEYLKKTNKVDDGQTLINEVFGYEDDEVEAREEEIKEVINSLIDKNDRDVIENFADYRNYMSYEIIINNEEISNGRLSKQAGYDSGAGTQIPYTLILSAALSMLYNERGCSTRLIFMDEPFGTMSDHNIKLMLDFFKSQNFQVIFCAPPNRTDSIGSECDAIIPVLRLRKDNMQIGSVQFHDQRD
jgi:chromosome segregation ATPase